MGTDTLWYLATIYSWYKDEWVEPLCTLYSSVLTSDLAPADYTEVAQDINRSKSSSYFFIMPLTGKRCHGLLQADIPEEVMRALQIARQDFGPTGRHMIKKVLEPVVVHIWSRLETDPHYVMTLKELKVFVFFEHEYLDEAFVESAKERASLWHYQRAHESCSNMRHLTRDINLQCYCRQTYHLLWMLCRNLI